MKNEKIDPWVEYYERTTLRHLITHSNIRIIIETSFQIYMSSLDHSIILLNRNYFQQNFWRKFVNEDIIFFFYLFQIFLVLNDFFLVWQINQYKEMRRSINTKRWGEVSRMKFSWKEILNWSDGFFWEDDIWIILYHNG